MEWRRSAFVFQGHIGATGQQGAYGLRRTGAHRPMERRHATAIESIRIRANGEEVRDRVSLCRRLPSVRVGGIVQRFGTPSISHTTVRATSH
jgi:hypothetical protein